MIALFDFYPSFCPNCGTSIRPTEYARQDYAARCSFRCDCGLTYQQADTERLLEAADLSGGDLSRQEWMR